LRADRGGVFADRARSGRGRGLDRVGMFVRHARAVSYAEGDGAAQPSRAELDPLQPRRLEYGRTDRSRDCDPTEDRREAPLFVDRGSASLMRIVVAMSGGVDSSVAAAMLAEAGHEVVGLSMQLYDQREGEH